MTRHGTMVSQQEAEDALRWLIVNHANALAQDMGHDGEATAEDVPDQGLTLTLDSGQQFSISIERL